MQNSTYSQKRIISASIKTIQIKLLSSSAAKQFTLKYFGQYKKLPWDKFGKKKKNCEILCNIQSLKHWYGWLKLITCSYTCRE